MGNNITPIDNPLMKSIEYNGQTYFTAQYFHQMYRNNSNMGGKYKRPADFLRLIRSIETYQEYINAKDIVEIKSMSDIPDTETQDLRLAYKSNNYAAIMLINATAQVALTHHLDDEVSKHVSVNANRQAARNESPLLMRDIKQAIPLLNAFMEAGKLLGTDDAMARAVAIDQVRKTTGMNFDSLLASNSVEEAPMNATDLGKEIGVGPQQMNSTLAEQGFQYKENGDWLPTEKGKPFCTCNPYKSKHSDHTGYRTLWYRKVLDEIIKAA